MFYKKKGFPEINEIVICTIKNILPHAVFVNLDEYDKEGMLHISEVSPGRIRNIRDYVREGKKITCKILRINKEKGHIDLSLRRVNLSQKRKKVEEYKQEQKAEKLLEYAAKESKINLETIYKEAGYKIIEDYGTLSEAFLDIVNNDLNLKELGIKKSIADKITELVKTKIKPPEVTISGTLKIENHKENGIEIIKNILKKAIKNNINISYLGAPKYKIIIKAKDYKTAESELKNITNNLEKDIKSEGGTFEFIRK
ncbi:MAG: translation initiation factor IF-2 subunit alpha [Nanoarchaeota archaeon]|nr:translation initiation factor IF-2 subunit alpha [Nanoarchaeota archaeon]